MKKKKVRRAKSAPHRPRKRASTVERAERALQDFSDKPPQKTDDPAKDRTAIEDGVIKPLDHAD